MEGPFIANSALKHGVQESDILHAFRNPIRAWDMEEGFLMLVGPDISLQFLEIGVVSGEDCQVIVHAMPARKKFLR